MKNDAWNRGEYPEYAGEEHKKLTFAEWDGGPLDPIDYMPIWTKEEATHWQMYETCSEGTPVSPIFADPEDLAEWLASNDASTSANHTASRDDWMSIINDSRDSLPTFTTGNNKITITIAGPLKSGKTTIAQLLHRQLLASGIMVDNRDVDRKDIPQSKDELIPCLRILRENRLLVDIEVVQTRRAQCGDCTEPAMWVRCTQFSGDHYFCATHAEQQEDFGKKDPSYFFWKTLGGGES